MNKDKPRIARIWFDQDGHIFSARVLVAGVEEEITLKNLLEKDSHYLGISGDLETIPEYEAYLKSQ